MEKHFRVVYESAGLKIPLLLLVLLDEEVDEELRDAFVVCGKRGRGDLLDVQIAEDAFAVHDVGEGGLLLVAVNADNDIVEIIDPVGSIDALQSKGFVK